MQITTYISLFLSVFLAIGILKIFRLEKQKNIQLLLTFSGAYLLSITCLHLIPDLFAHHPENNIGLFILFGFLMQIILEYFSQGIEHGHLYKNKILSNTIMMSLCIHAFLEGFPLGGHLNINTHEALLSGIILHKIPVSIVLFSFFLQSRMSKRMIYFMLLLFASMTPLGVYTAGLFQVIADYHNEIIALVIGMFIYISTTILFESTDGHRFSLQKIIFILVGLVLGILII